MSLPLESNQEPSVYKTLALPIELGKVIIPSKGGVSIGRNIATSPFYNV